MAKDQAHPEDDQRWVPSNLQANDSMAYMVQHAEDGPVEMQPDALLLLDEQLERVDRERYDFYFENEKEALYEIDPWRMLLAFYEDLGKREVHFFSPSEYQQGVEWLELVNMRAAIYAERARLNYKPPFSSFKSDADPGNENVIGAEP
jgi:hypothetical protein